MAKQQTKVLLGFEDELVTEKNKGLLNFTVNKIGGKPDLPKSVKLDPPICPSCQLPRPQVVQIYAPLENSNYHRTFYVFACINPNCWTVNESWLCIRVQTLETIESEETASNTLKQVSTDWGVDADDWDDNNSNLSEENGNVINNLEKFSDEDEESCSLEDSIRSGFGNLTVDDRNANVGAQGGAVGRLHSPSASAEIEGNEGEVITIDTPTYPQNDIHALMQEATPLPPEMCHNFHPDSKKFNNLQFTPSFMSVFEETNSNFSNISDRHVKELLQEYQQQNEGVTVSPGAESEATPLDPALEKYEKSRPAHGDQMFHHFLSKIQANPAQILRYSRNPDSPLFLYPLQDPPKKCQYCNDQKQSSRLEFGTVLIFTCKKSCWNSEATTRTETVILQNETY